MEDGTAGKIPMRGMRVVYGDGQREFDALIIGVHSEKIVNVCIIDPNPNCLSPHGGQAVVIPEVRHASITGTGGQHWVWPQAEPAEEKPLAPVTPAALAELATAVELATAAVVENYIAGLEWGDTPDETKTLVAGNIRGFAGWLRDNVPAPKPIPTANATGKGKGKGKGGVDNKGQG